MELPFTGPVADGALAEAARAELGEADDPVLDVGEGRDPYIGRGAWVKTNDASTQRHNFCAYRAGF